MWSRMPGCARPVRIFARSCFSVSTDFAIFSVACFLISPIVIQSSAEFLPTNSTYAFQTSAMHQRALVFAHHHSLERPRLEDREYVDRKLLVAAKRERGGVLTFDEAFVKNLKVMDATALALCRDQKLPINVFSIFKSGALKRVVMGEDEGTLVHS